MSVIAAAEGQVGLLIDFENLVRAVDEEDIDCEAVFRLADEYGRVLVANAYADWRMKDVNQYQADLYGLGIDLVHVFGQRRGALIKNAVDVKMAVDAVSLMSSLPHIDVYVIVSGDRDFIHVLKELRRHGKTVIGVSPNSAVSSDFSSLCDRFVRYEALTSAVEPTGAESIGEVRAKLAEIVRDNPDGLRGSEVKTMLPARCLRVSTRARTASKASGASSERWTRSREWFRLPQQGAICACTRFPPRGPARPKPRSPTCLCWPS